MSILLLSRCLLVSRFIKISPSSYTIIPPALGAGNQIIIERVNVDKMSLPVFTLLARRSLSTQLTRSCEKSSGFYRNHIPTFATSNIHLLNIVNHLIIKKKYFTHTHTHTHTNTFLHIDIHRYDDEASCNCKTLSLCASRDYFKVPTCHVACHDAMCNVHRSQRRGNRF